MARQDFFDGDTSHRCQPQRSGRTELCATHDLDFPALRARFSVLMAELFSDAELAALDAVVGAAMLPEDEDCTLVFDEDYGKAALTDWRYFRRPARRGMDVVKFSEQAGDPPNGYGQPGWWLPEDGEQEQ